MIGAGTYDEGETVTLTAVPLSGYEFDGWTEGGSSIGSTNPLVFTASTDRTVVANFKAS